MRWYNENRKKEKMWKKIENDMYNDGIVGVISKHSWKEKETKHNKTKFCG